MSSSSESSDISLHLQMIKISLQVSSSTMVRSDVLARLGPKAVALVWPEPALAFSRAGPSQSRHSRLGPGPARPKPWLLAHILIKFIYNANRHGKNNE